MRVRARAAGATVRLHGGLLSFAMEGGALSTVQLGDGRFTIRYGKTADNSTIRQFDKATGREMAQWGNGAGLPGGTETFEVAYDKHIGQELVSVLIAPFLTLGEAQQALNTIQREIQRKTASGNGWRYGRRAGVAVLLVACLAIGFRAVTSATPAASAGHPLPLITAKPAANQPIVPGGVPLPIDQYLDAINPDHAP